MDPTFRRAFNASFSSASYDDYRQRLEAEVGPIPFRLAESPLFLPPKLRDRLFRCAEEVMVQLAEPSLLARAQSQIPHDFEVPGMDDAPGCMTVDFALVRNEDGELDGRVVELQAFPSIFAFTLVQARLFDELLRAQPWAQDGFHCFRPDLDFTTAAELFRQCVLAGEAPEHVVLLEIDPENQKTRPDFVATRTLAGIDPVCVTEVFREGRQLFRRVEGRKVPIRRIFNRVVFDELEKRRPPMAFAFTDPLDVTWCPHPNWYWMWSKFSLPLLEHPCVPRSVPVSRFDPAEPLEGYVLKPLYSFAGAGVNLEPTAADLAAIPPEQRDGWILQRKVEYARELWTPEGIGVAAELRVLCMRGPGEKLPRPFMNLVRLSRGKMLGIDFNKGLDWVGSTVALWPRAPALALPAAVSRSAGDSAA
jgi:hypothetical protein